MDVVLANEAKMVCHCYGYVYGYCWDGSYFKRDIPD